MTGRRITIAEFCDDDQANNGKKVTCMLTPDKPRSRYPTHRVHRRLEFEDDWFDPAVAHRQVAQQWVGVTRFEVHDIDAATCHIYGGNTEREAESYVPGIGYVCARLGFASGPYPFGWEPCLVRIGSD